jgi:poly-gamma-glutamate capsule biosynthesis protein CapA/YwtB (metallophosphatase superfamily)
MSSESVVLMACGDIGPLHAPMETYSTLVQAELARADIRFGQVERVYSQRGALQIHSSGGHSRVDPSFASVFSDCGIDVASMASNHAMDWGPDALLDSIDVLRRRGIQVIGAGANLEAARQPAILKRKGVSIAVLAYCSILREGYAATRNSAGVAPLRVRTYYEPTDYQPGVPAQIETVPNEDDVAALRQDIAAARRQADVVIVSMHWGVHFIPRLIADYQPQVAKLAFDAGADLILGHHAHVPKAIQVIDGKVCFHSLSNFIMSSAEKAPARIASFQRKYGVVLDPAYPRLAYGVDAKRSLVAKAILSRDGVTRVSFLPALIDRQLRPEILRGGDPRFKEMVDYMEWASAEFDHRFLVDGDEVVIDTGDHRAGAARSQMQTAH